MDSISMRILSLRDVDALTALYRSVEISRANYKEMLDGEGALFSRRGGMFFIHNVVQNAELLSSADDVVLGAEQGGKLVGMVWYNFTDADYPYDEIEYFQDCEEQREKVKAFLKSGTLFAGKEIIVSPEAKGRLALRFFERMFADALDAGMKYMSGEVYRVNGFEDEEGLHSVDLLNMPSYMTLKGTGGIAIGTARQRRIEKEGMAYFITPQVFLWDIESSLKSIRERIARKAEAVSFGGKA